MPALLAPYLSVGDEGYVLWCGPRETAELLEQVAALEAKKDLETAAALMVHADAMAVAIDGLLDRLSSVCWEHHDSMHVLAKYADCARRSYRAAFPKEEKP